MKIYIVRHEKRYESPTFFTSLTNEGKNDAEKLAEQLNDIEFDYIYSSPFLRTIQTVYPYCKKHNKPDTIQIINVKNVAKFPLQQIGNIMYEKLDAIPKLLEANVVVIENQPSIKNPKMKSVAETLYSWFLIRGIIDKEKNNSILLAWTPEYAKKRTIAYNAAGKIANNTLYLERIAQNPYYENIIQLKSIDFFLMTICF